MDKQLCLNLQSQSMFELTKHTLLTHISPNLAAIYASDRNNQSINTQKAGLTVLVAKAFNDNMPENP